MHVRTTPWDWDRDLTLDTALGDTPEIGVGEANQGTVFIPATSTITLLTFHAAPKKGGTYLPLQTAAGAAVTLTVAAEKAYPLPAECFGCGAIKITTNADGAVSISLKG